MTKTESKEVCDVEEEEQQGGTGEPRVFRAGDQDAEQRDPGMVLIDDLFAGDPLYVFCKLARYLPKRKAKRTKVEASASVGPETT